MQGGCIIRAGFLSGISKAYAKNPELANLLVDPDFAQVCVAIPQHVALYAVFIHLHEVFQT